MLNTHDINYDFLGPDFSTELPGLLHAPPGLEGAASPVYRGPGRQESPGAPCGEKVPHKQTDPGTSGMSPSARVWSLASTKTSLNPSSLLLPPSSLLSSFLPSSLMNLLPSSPVVLLSGTAPGPQHRSRVEWSGLCLLGLLPTALHPLP